MRLRVLGERALAEAFQTRCALEGFAVQCAARAQSEGLLLPAHLREVEHLAVACDKATRSSGAAADRVFHLALAALAGNSQIDSLLTVIWDQTPIATRAGLTEPPRINSVHHEHEDILSALRAGGSGRTRGAVEAHIGQTEQTIHVEPDETKEYA
ncbi:MAG TPA: FCD domain-containing protein [Candidatus Stackebrandtia excrementipullorum]|nr:FCD domain-containing protein [Candidatus Stackebrandtia excrementipullorum]